MAMEKESQKSKKKKAKDKWGESVLSPVEVREAKGRAEARQDADEVKKSKSRKENKDKLGLSSPSAAEKRSGNGPFNVCHESENERKSKKNKKARKDERGQPIVNTAEDHEGDDKAEDRGEPDKERKSKKRKKEKQDRLGQSIPTAVAEDSNGDNYVDAGHEAEDEQKLKKKKKKTKKDKWGQPIPSAAEQHDEFVPPKAVRQPNKLERGTEAQVAKTYQYEPKKVVISGMPYTTTEEEIQELFKDVGPIVQMQLSRFPDSGNFRGLAFITFLNEEITKKALELDGMKMGNRFVKVERCRQDPRKMSKSEFSEEPQKVEGCFSVYVGNLSWEVTEDDIRNFFCASKIESVRLAVHKKTGKFRGFCHVDFADDESLELAVSKNQAELHGRKVKVSYAVSNKD